MISYEMALGLLSVWWLDEIGLVPKSIFVFACPHLHIHIMGHKNGLFSIEVNLGEISYKQ